MKIQVIGKLLISKLVAQRDRALAKKKEAELFLSEHVKHHKQVEDKPDANGEDKTTASVRALFGSRARRAPGPCVFEMQVNALVAHIDSHVRRLDAVIEVIDQTKDYKLSLKNYINSYVDCPYDSVVFPAPETSDEAGATQGLMSQSVQKMN